MNYHSEWEYLGMFGAWVMFHTRANGEWAAYRLVKVKGLNCGGRKVISLDWNGERFANRKDLQKPKAWWPELMDWAEARCKAHAMLVLPTGGCNWLGTPTGTPSGTPMEHH
jgi:hypothetical protein